jgi:hypothetical protein
MNKLEELKALLNAATPLPLKVNKYDHGGGRLFHDEPRKLVADFYDQPDRDLFLAMRDQISDLIAVAEAAQCIRHWHDLEPDGMVVSAEHVRLLWVALLPLTKDMDK